MVFSAVSGLSIVSGAENSETVVREVEAAKNNKIYTSSTSANQSSVLKNSIIPNFEDYIFEYSNNLMKFSSTFTEVSKISSLSDNGSSGADFWISSEDIDSQLRSAGFNPGDYDQIICAANLGDIPKSYWGLGGVRYTGTKSGYAFISLSADDLSENGNITSTWRDSSGNLNNHFCDVYVHEFMHCLEFYVSYEYPEGVSRSMPSPDAAGTYYSQISDLMEDFYKNFFRGTVPVSKKSTTTFGMTAWDYKNTPRTYNSSEKLGTVTVSDEASLSKAFFDIAMGAGDSNTTLNLSANIVCTGVLPSIKTFDGTIDGNGYAVVNAKLLNAHGLVERLNGTIQNLNLVNINVNSAGIESSEIGAFAGTNLGTIKNCSVRGSISSNEWNTASFCGTNRDTITDCYSTARIYGKEHSAGIVAINESTITNCFFAGSAAAQKTACSIAYAKGNTQNVYAVKGSASDSVSSDDSCYVSNDALTTDEFLSSINSNNAWKMGKNYPILSNQQYEEDEFDEFTSSGGFYSDSALTQSVDSVSVWANGGNVKQTDGSKINYKSAVIYTDMTPQAVDVKGKMKTGRLQTATTSTSAAPVIINGKLTKDKNAESIAKASIKKDGKVTINAGKNTGTVYIWVYDLRADKTVVDMISIKVNVSAASYKLALYSDAECTIVAKTGAVTVGETKELYFTSLADKTGTLTTEATFTATVDQKSANYVECTVEGNKITLNALSLNSAKPGKTVKAKITVQCDQNGKKANYTLTLVNPVTEVKPQFTSENTIIAAKNDKLTFNINPVTELENTATTASCKILVTTNEPIADTKGKVTSTKAKCVSASYKNGTVTLKRTSAGSCYIYAVYTSEKVPTILLLASVAEDGTVTLA